MSTTITFRKPGVPAVNVKDDWVFSQHANTPLGKLIDALPEDVVSNVYEGVREDFWTLAAPRLAADHGYGRVWSEGRSGGWLVVEKPPVLDLEHQDLDGTDLDTDEEQLQVNRAGWEVFEREIEQEIEYLRDYWLVERLEEALTERQAAERRTATVKALNAFELVEEAVDCVRRRLPRPVLEGIVLADRETDENAPNERTGVDS